MYNLGQYLRHRWSAKSKHGVHSPFVYEFVTKVLPFRSTEFGRQVEQFRKSLLRENRTVDIEDFGAGYGGKSIPHIQKTIAQVVRSSARRHPEGELLSRIVGHYAPKQALELGTNLGFSTLYLLSHANDLELISIEGSKELSNLAGEHLSRFSKQAQLVVGEFGQVLRSSLDWSRFQPTFVLLDGNHTHDATIEYFELLLPKLGTQAILVLDDIYWSKGMTRAWRTIIAHPRVTVSIDLFHLGICFLDRPQAKEHFQLKSSYW